MNQLLKAAKAVIEVWDAGRGVWDQINALRAAVERAEKHEGVGFDKYWRKEKYRWDKNLQRDVQAVWTDAQQAERERLWTGVIIAVERLKTKDTEGLLSDFTDRILEAADNECKEIKTAAQQAERERCREIVITMGGPDVPELLRQIDSGEE